MAQQVIYKNIGIKDETTWGVSTGTTPKVLQVVSSSLNANPNKSLVEDTRTSSKGRDRMVRLKNEIDGDITSFASPKVLHNFFELVNGSQGSSVSSGDSKMAVLTYNQNTDGNFISTSVIQDRNNTQEAFYGVRGTKLSLSASDGIVEAALTVMGKTRGTGASIVDSVGETVKPFTFADVTVSIGRPSYANPYTLQVSEWNIDYDNGMERTHLSGSRDASRTDAMVPQISGSFKIFHEGNSWNSAVYGCSEFYLRFEATTDSCHGLIAGLTPYYMRIDIPRTELTSTVKNYEQAELSVETIEFTGMFDAGLSALWRPQLTVDTSIDT